MSHDQTMIVRIIIIRIKKTFGSCLNYFNLNVLEVDQRCLPHMLAWGWNGLVIQEILVPSYSFWSHHPVGRGRELFDFLSSCVVLSASQSSPAPDWTEAEMVGHQFASVRPVEVRALTYMSPPHVSWLYCFILTREADRVCVTNRHIKTGIMVLNSFKFLSLWYCCQVVCFVITTLPKLEKLINCWRTHTTAQLLVYWFHWVPA